MNRQSVILALSAFFIFSISSTICTAASPFDDALGFWNFATTADSSPNGNNLLPEKSAEFGVDLTDKEKSDSLARHGDGVVVQTAGSPLLVGGQKDALAVSGGRLTLLVRAKDATGAWGGELVKRREPTLSYNIYTFDFGKGPRNMTLGFEIGTAGHPFATCRFPMDRLSDRNGWLDIVARYDGTTMELIVNGEIMASAAVSGALVSAPDDQFMIGNNFKGQIDTVAVWKRALSDTEVKELSDTKNISKSAYLNTATNRGPFYNDYQKMIDDYGKSPAPYSELFRPQFHWTPVSGWMNDANGLVYFNGLWRQFAQHNLDNEDGKRWGYATSPDLVHWTQHPEAILPDQIGDIWSGSAVVDEHDTSGFFHGKPGIVCIYTYFNQNDGGRQCQGIAYSADGVTFTKYSKNPVIPELRNVTGQEDDVDFRDPKVFWYAPTNRWVMVTGGGFLRVWSSTNLRDWTNEAVEKNIVTECPDLFPLYLDDNRKSAPIWVLSKAGAGYMLGSFDGHQFTPSSDTTQRFNFGPDFYASQTYSNATDHRRIMSTWMWGWGDDDPAGIATTGGMMTLPVELSLVSSPDGPRVASIPASEVDALRGTPHIAVNIDLAAETDILHDSGYGNQCEIDADLNMGTATKAGISVLAGGNGNETLIGYDTAKHEVFVDRSHSGLTGVNKAGDYYSAPLALKSNSVQLRIYVDRASIEAFADNGLVPITVRCFPPSDAQNINAFAVGGTAKITSIRVYPLESIWRK
jgi:fructan beta-fructosidase